MTDVKHVETLAGLAPRGRDAHKGDFGRVLVVGGSAGMIGAPALAATAGLRGGAGLVTLAVPAMVQQSVAMLCECATSARLACDADGQLTAGAVGQFARLAAEADVLAVGPGMNVGTPQADIVRVALNQTLPLVLDADGLNNLAKIDNWPALRQGPVILTPHPGEFSRLTGRSVGEIQADRQAAVLAAMEAWSADGSVVLVLKGAGTIVTDGKWLYVNSTGNPGMATGGSGDVLTGLIAGLVACGLEPFDAACLGAHLHGRAGDLAAEELSQTAMIASDLLDYLPYAIKEFEG
ncbi:MAG: NAD(P)H-hydrate dehydratase [Phycisphaerae bacterium]|nr:NAD(P)H-hydrate dehydratase [Phycisphaerae bacterium]